MADIALINPSPVMLQIDEIKSGFAGAGGLTLGQAVYLDPTTGTYLPTDATNAAKVGFRGIVTSPGVGGGPGQAVGITERGYIAGYDLTGLPFDSLVYLSNTPGMLSTTVGATSAVVGRVAPMTDKDPVTGQPSRVLYIRQSVI